MHIFVILTSVFQVSSYEEVPGVMVDNVHKHQAMESWQIQTHSLLSFFFHGNYLDMYVLIRRMVY